MRFVGFGQLLHFNNTPAWDWWTYDRNHGSPYRAEYTASEYEICQAGHHGSFGGAMTWSTASQWGSTKFTR